MMKIAPKSILTVMVAAGLAGLIATAIARGQTPAAVAPAGPPPTKLAVVNIVELFDKLDEKAAADAEIDTMKKAYEQADRTWQTKIDLAIENLDKTFRRGTAEFRVKQEEILAMQVQQELERQVNQKKLFLELRLRTADLYNRINEAVAAYSVANGIALVFVADN